MFICRMCRTVVPPGTKATRVVTATRAKKYSYREKAHRFVRTDYRGVRKVTILDDPGGTGREIASEATVCPACSERN